MTWLLRLSLSPAAPRTECSGNVDASNIRALADLGVDFISSGALTHSAPILDLSLKHLRLLDGKIMNARERRRAIMDVLEVAKEPVSGSALAQEVGVSRQVVVQDIALLRADGHDVVATNRGYVLQEAPSSPAVPTRLVKVRHSVEQAGDELTSIVDAGGAVLNVIVNHRVYGKITADLDIRNRRDVERYLHDIESGKSFPLLTVTSGYHFHRIAAEDEQTLDEIETMLKEKGYLADLMPYEDDLS